MKKTLQQTIREWAIMTGGTLLFTVAIYFFKFPNHFSTGGVSGLAVLLGELTAMTPATYTLIINMALLAVGFLFIGRGFGAKTVYCCTLQSVLTYLLEWVYPMDKPITDEPFLELMIATFLTAAGSALLFNVDASTGGTDIVAMIIKKYFKINISMALFIADCIIVLSVLFVFGLQTWIYCLVGFFCKVFLVNNLLESINLSKYCTVIVRPELEEPICTFITEQLNRSATVSKAYHGAYGGADKSVLLVVLNRGQTVQLKRFVRALDQKAFIIVTNTGDICGKGFRELM